MLATFCLRLACGLSWALVVLSPQQVNPRFFRVQFLTILGLVALAAVSRRAPIVPVVWASFGAAMLAAFLSSAAWSLDQAPGGRTLMMLTAAATLAAMCAARGLEPAPETMDAMAEPGLAWSLADDSASALLLGTATTAMLMGHSYLIAPTMALTPLYRLLGLLAGATFVRMLLAGAGLWFWTAGHSLGNLDDETVLWLPLRWGLGLVAPLVLGWMAWQTTKIRSTQSATGILYVVVIFCFLGELTSQLLVRSTGFVL